MRELKLIQLVKGDPGDDEHVWICQGSVSPLNTANNLSPVRNPFNTGDNADLSVNICLS